MTNIYGIGIDLGRYGAIALIAPYLKDSLVIPTPKTDKWIRPLDIGEVKIKNGKKVALKEEDVFQVKGKNKGDRLYSHHPNWGGNLVRHESIIKAIEAEYAESLYDVQSYLEDPGAQGGTRAGFDNSKTVGMNTYPWILAMEQLTRKQPWRVSVNKWQQHPAIATWGKADYTHGAKDSSEAKKHQAIALANELFNKDISFEKKGADGLADALLIGLYGALKYPPVIKLDYEVALFALTSETADIIDLPTDIPFTEALIYSAYNGRPEREGIVGYVTLSGDRHRQKIISRRVYPELVEFDMGGRAIAAYYNQLPHLI